VTFQLSHSDCSALGYKMARRVDIFFFFFTTTPHSHYHFQPAIFTLLHTHSVMSNPSRLCATAQSALVLGRKSLASAKPFQSNPFSAGTHGDKTGPPTPRSSIAIVQPSMQSQAPRAPQSNSLFTSTGDVSQPSKTFTRAGPDSARSLNNTNVNTRDGASLQVEQTLPSAAGNSMQGDHFLPSNASPSLDQREPTLGPAQYETWSNIMNAKDRISTRADGNFTSSNRR
jgi:hypothetical protein